MQTTKHSITIDKRSLSSLSFSQTNTFLFLWRGRVSAHLPHLPAEIGFPCFSTPFLQIISYSGLHSRVFNFSSQCYSQNSLIFSRKPLIFFNPYIQHFSILLFAASNILLSVPTTPPHRPLLTSPQARTTFHRTPSYSQAPGHLLKKIFHSSTTNSEVKLSGLHSWRQK